MYLDSQVRAFPVSHFLSLTHRSPLYFYGLRSSTDQTQPFSVIVLFSGLEFSVPYLIFLSFAEVLKSMSANTDDVP